MAESVRVLPEELKTKLIVYEWDMRTLEGVARFRELKARSLPSIYMDGELVYASMIPGQEVLINEIERRYRQQN